MTPEEAERQGNPFLAKALRRQEAKERAEREKKNVRKRPEEIPDETSRLGDLADNSIFKLSLMDNKIKVSAKGAAMGQPIPPGRVTKLDPMPHRRRRWERKMTIREIQRRGRLTRAEVIKRTERSYVSRSDLLKTSMKKLSPLANQIAGKTVDDAITQMRFSKKKPAIAVREHLELARDQAIVSRGMGLGQTDNTEGSPVTFRTKDGILRRISDRTSMYIAQAWVNKGPYGQDINPRARGRIDRLRLPQTSISVLLKEEATRIREQDDRQKKEANKKVWTALPDRPVTEQRQYYSW
ncbi:MAG: hypothetical protein Q9162_004888 [Coniocarpon cinnabarinum]